MNSKVVGVPPCPESFRGERSADEMIKRQSPAHHRCAATTLVLLLACCATTFAASVVTTSSIDGGGLRATSASYTMDGSVGGIAGISTVASPPETVKHGYIGQLAEVASMSATGTPTQVSEGATSQLSGSATMDDTTVTTLAGSDVAWGAYAWPIHDISVSGVATTDWVYANTPATINCSYLGVSGSGQLLVLDSLPDNYGSYAGDTLPDNWQVGYFGLNNPNAAPDKDVTGTGQNNLFKYVAGLDPTNRASVFKLRVENVVGQPNQKKLTFLPWAGARAYTPEFRTDLRGGGYVALGGYSGPQASRIHKLPWSNPPLHFCIFCRDQQQP